MSNILDHYTLSSFLSAVRQDRRQTLREFSQHVGITPQAIGSIFAGEERLVINHLSGWKKAFKFHRLEGMYFELLAILAAFPSSPERQRLRLRTLSLVKHLLLRPELQAPAPAFLTYVLSPECGLLRNLLDMADFPLDSAEIPEYAAKRLGAYREARGLSEREFKENLALAWTWLVAQNVVVRAQDGARYTKVEPMFVTVGRQRMEKPEAAATFYSVPHADILRELAEQVGTPAVAVSKVATLPLPRAAQEAANALIAAFLEDMTALLNIAVNEDECARLAQDDPARLKQVEDFRHRAAALGIELPRLSDADFNTLIQIAVTQRLLTTHEVVPVS